MKGPVQLIVLSLPLLLELSDNLSLRRLRALHPHELRHHLRDHGMQNPHSFHGFCRHGAMRRSQTRGCASMKKS